MSEAAEGGTQSAESELPTGLYDGILGKSDTPDDLTPDEPEADGTEPAKADEPEAGTPEPNKTTTGSWEDRWHQANEALGRQGREFGEKVKALESKLAHFEKQQQPPIDPFANDPTLKALDPTQKDILLRGTSVAQQRLLQDQGMEPSDLPRMKQQIDELVKETQRKEILREVGEIRKEVGEAVFAKNLPKLQQIAANHPTLSPQEAWKLATSDDNRQAESKKVKALEAERKQRAASADFGKERPNKPTDGKLTQAELRKLSAVPQGRPSPRLAALLRETRREFGS